MFKRKTLFVLGAGASREVEIPIGVKLAEIISRLLDVGPVSVKNPTGEALLQQLYERYPLRDNGYTRAAKRISEGVRYANSIDDFLDRHSDNEQIQRVGKIAIVKSILDAESKSLFAGGFRSASLLDAMEDTWYIKFFRMLGAGVNVSNIEQIFDNVSFVIFNYDRCLEYFLLNALQFTYGIGSDNAHSVLENLDVVHPYGIAAPLPAQGVGVPFGGPKDYDCDYASLSQDIKIYTEQIAAGDMLKRVRGMMFWAEQIVFLGFGYHEPNMRMLRPGEKMNLKPVFGTAVGMSESSILEVRKELASMFAGDPAGTRAPMQVTDKTCSALFDYHIKTLPE
jgi:hypothetical protein